jgi:hypothetical protein
LKKLKKENYMPRHEVTHLEMDLGGKESICTIEVHPDPNKGFNEDGQFIIRVINCNDEFTAEFKGETIFIRGAGSADKAGNNFLDDVKGNGFMPASAFVYRTSVERYSLAA